ncbi:hypothetical protein [Oerskovia enterophila]|uniref:Uncharacterized protein n=1 Tax=Oerskovia enterophila TaxID=43678 RepID=A0A163QV05_9CELL|nr:hypothetical protein [Oerskovia enterophila]KZM34563.1 hypothetical protein OJAG_28620 [Oerskovia enterophila]
MADDDVTPADLARELGRTAPQIRRVLRRKYGTLVAPEDRWHLTPAQVEFVKVHFTNRG